MAQWDRAGQVARWVQEGLPALGDLHDLCHLLGLELQENLHVLCLLLVQDILAFRNQVGLGPLANLVGLIPLYRLGTLVVLANHLARACQYLVAQVVLVLLLHLVDQQVLLLQVGLVFLPPRAILVVHSDLVFQPLANPLDQEAQVVHQVLSNLAILASQSLCLPWAQEDQAVQVCPCVQAPLEAQAAQADPDPLASRCLAGLVALGDLAPQASPFVLHHHQDQGRPSDLAGRLHQVYRAFPAFRVSLSQDILGDQEDLVFHGGRASLDLASLEGPVVREALGLLVDPWDQDPVVPYHQVVGLQGLSHYWDMTDL